MNPQNVFAHWMKRPVCKRRPVASRFAEFLSAEHLEQRQLLSVANAPAIVDAPPAVQSITIPVKTITTSTAEYTVTFSEAVTGVDASDFFVLTTKSALANSAVTVTPVSDSVYKVTVSDIEGGGTAGINLVNNQSIKDSANQSPTSGFVGPQTKVKFDGNRAPTDLYLNIVTKILENSPAGTVVGNLAAKDAPGDTFTYSLVAGKGSSGNPNFTIEGNTLKSTATFDFEEQWFYSIRVKVTDQAGMSLEKRLTVFVTDVNEPPRLAPQTFNFKPPEAKNLRSGSPVGELKFSDPDTATKYREVNFTIIAGDPGNMFLIDKRHTLLRVGNVANFLAATATQSTFTFTVKVTDFYDPSLTDTTQITVNVPSTATKPAVVSLKRDVNTPINDFTTDYTVKFDRAVTGVDAADFAVITTGDVAANPAVVVTKISDTEYKVTINVIERFNSGGTLGLNLVDPNQTIRDTNNNSLGANFTFVGQVYQAVP